jgi:hypothetical protein
MPSQEQASPLRSSYHKKPIKGVGVLRLGLITTRQFGRRASTDAMTSYIDDEFVFLPDVDHEASPAMGWRQGTTARPPTAQRSRLNRTLSLPQSGRLVLGANLNCSESRRWAACPSCASTRTRIAHGERLDCHSTGTEDAAALPERQRVVLIPRRSMPPL